MHEANSKCGQTTCYNNLVKGFTEDDISSVEYHTMATSGLTVCCASMSNGSVVHVVVNPIEASTQEEKEQFAYSVLLLKLAKLHAQVEAFKPES